MPNPSPSKSAIGSRAAQDLPFWERMRPMLAYPLQSEALLTISLLALLRLLGYVPGMGWVLNIIITAALFKYAAEVLSNTANGNMEAPTGYSTPDSVGWVVLKVQVLMWVLAIVLVIMLGRMGFGELAWIPAIAIALGAPAALMSAAIDQDTFGALNPGMWWATITRIGWPYIGASLLCLVIMYSEANARDMLVPFLPGPLAIVGHYFIGHYATIVTFHLLGYLVYQYRDELGYQIKTNTPTALPRPPDRDQTILDESERLAADGKTLEAARILGAHLDERGGTDSAHLRYRKLLALHGDQAGLDKHSRLYLNVLIAHDKWRVALEFWAECRSANADLWPSDPDQVRELVEQAHALGQQALSLKFANGFARAFPKHTSVPLVHLRVAQALTEALGQRDQARALLDATATSYPKSKYLPEIEAYRARL
jgi:hypothetical protein